MSLPNLDQRLDQMAESLDFLWSNFDPHGLVTANGEAVKQYSDISLQPDNYLTILSYHGKVAEGDRINGTVDYLSDAMVPVGNLTKYGIMSPYAAAAFCLKKSILYDFRRREWSNGEGIDYEKATGVTSNLDTSLSTGFLSMAKAIELSAAAQVVEQAGVTPELLNVLVLPAIKTIIKPVANLPLKATRLLEILYGLRYSGSYGPDSAIFEMGLDESANYGVAIGNNGEPQLSNWEAARQAALVKAGKGRCHILDHPTFDLIWHRQVDIATRMPELFAQTIQTIKQAT